MLYKEARSGEDSKQVCDDDVALVIPELGDGHVEEERDDDEDKANDATDRVEPLELLIKGVQVCQGGAAASRKCYDVRKENGITVLFVGNHSTLRNPKDIETLPNARQTFLPLLGLNISAVVLVLWIAEIAHYQEVMSSTPPTSKVFSREAATQ